MKILRLATAILFLSQIGSLRAWAAPEAAVVNAGSDEIIVVPPTCNNTGQVIDGMDFNIWNAANPSRPGDPNWNPVADMNKDGSVDGRDFIIWNAAKFSTPADSHWDSRANIAGTVNHELTLNGTVNEGGSLIVAVRWVQIEGPAPAIFEDITDPQSNVTFPDLGHYVFELQVKERRSILKDAVSFQVLFGPVDNQAPLVTVGADQTIQFANTPITMSLDGSTSDDCLPDPPSTTTPLWSVSPSGDGISILDVSSLNTSATITEPGEYTFQLGVHDGELTGTDSMTVTVLPIINEPPTVEITGPTDVTYPEIPTYNAVITDDDLTNITVLWSQIGGPPGVNFDDPTLLNTTTEFPGPGTYTIQVEVTDGPHTVTDTIIVVVSEPAPINLPPTVEITGPTDVTYPEIPTYNAVITDDDLTNITVLWSQISGPPGVNFDDPTQINTATMFPGPGTYTIQVEVTDGPHTIIRTIIIEVKEPTPTEIVSIPEFINFFNPNQGTLQYGFNLAQTGHVKVDVVDHFGDSVKTLLNGTLSSGGPHIAKWDGNNYRGNKSGSGTYIILFLFDGRLVGKNPIVLYR